MKPKIPEILAQVLIDDEAHDFCDATEHVSYPRHVSLSNQVTLLGGQVTPW